MTKTVDDRFQDYLQRIVPLPTEGKAARRHKGSVGTCLKSRFEGAKLIPTGSSPRGTALRRHSDADYFVAIPRGIITNDSDEMLRCVRLALRSTFPNSDISVSKPAVVVPFGRNGSESLDIVPAVFVAKRTDGHYVFDIPNGVGGWTRSSPGAHKAYVNALDARHKYRVKPLIMLIKAWNVQWSKPVRNFYLELRVAKYAATVSSIDYARGIERVFESMIGTKGLTGMRDPLDMEGLIRPCMTDRQAQQALTSAKRALARAAEARKAEASGNIAKALERWDLFFNHTFLFHK